MKSVLVVCLLVTLCAAVPTQLTYTLGANYIYNVSGVVENNGYDSVANGFVPGYYSTMQAIMVMQPIEEDDTAYLFVMNLFNTIVSVDNSSSASVIGADGDSLGEDMYFTQLKTGEIIEIQYYSDDPIYYVNVKASAINAFQTSIVGVGNSKVVLESDPVGNHSSQVTGTAGADGSLILTKVFTQIDFTAFPDPTLTSKNMNINAKAVTGIHANGYVISSSLNQLAIYTDATPSQTLSAKQVSMTNSTGLDLDLSAIGSLSVSYAPNDAFQAKVFSAKADGYIVSNFFNYAAKTTDATKASAFTLDLATAVETIISKDKVKLTTLTKIGNHLRYNPDDSMHFVKLFESGYFSDATFRDRFFFVMTVAQNQDILVQYLSSKNCDILIRAVLSTPHIKNPSQTLIAALRSVLLVSECPVAQASAHSMLMNDAPIAASDFPYNKSISESVHLGGKVAAADFSASLFAGTNFNCKNTQFNFEGSAQATATASLFGYSQQALAASIVYGQENGAPLADAITLSVWGNVVYNHAIPTIDCKAATYPLAHTAPGFNVEHTLWVSIIPIVFSAAASLDLTLTWGWNVCPANLAADVDLSGNGEIELSGSSYTDLLLLRAGFDLEGQLNTDIVPEVYIDGNLCEIGFEVDADNSPMDASITSYYQWRECKYLFFDCHWGNHNQHTWWEWDAPADNKVLFKQTYNIIN